MSQSDSKFAPRMPRHDAVDSRPPPVEVRCVYRGRSHLAQLLNFSRSGLQLRVPLELSVDQKITLKITDSEELDLSLSATVRWCSGQEPAAWNIGCQFDDAVDWESLGELFLRGVLSTKGPD